MQRQPPDTSCIAAQAPIRSKGPAIDETGCDLSSSVGKNCPTDGLHSKLKLARYCPCCELQGLLSMQALTRNESQARVTANFGRSEDGVVGPDAAAYCRKHVQQDYNAIAGTCQTDG